jgi:hypothetical protein
MEWSAWLEEDISSMFRRKDAIKTLIEDGILPLFKRIGYTMSCTPHELGSIIATIMYEHGRKSLLSVDLGRHPYSKCELFDDYRMHYDETMGYESWKHVWLAWVFWTELTADMKGLIEEVCWLNTDLASSPEIMAFDAQFEEEEEVSSYHYDE